MAIISLGQAKNVGLSAYVAKANTQAVMAAGRAPT
jgi:hypothetical protein